MADFSGIDEDEAINIPRIGDPPRPSGDRPHKFAPSRAKTSKGSIIKTDKGRTPSSSGSATTKPRALRSISIQQT